MKNLFTSAVVSLGVLAWATNNSTAQTSEKLWEMNKQTNKELYEISKKNKDAYYSNTNKYGNRNTSRLEVIDANTQRMEVIPFWETDSIHIELTEEMLQDGYTWQGQYVVMDKGNIHWFRWERKNGKPSGMGSLLTHGPRMTLVHMKDGQIDKTKGWFINTHRWRAPIVRENKQYTIIEKNPETEKELDIFLKTVYPNEKN